MPRFFIDSYNDVPVIDEAGLDLSGLDEARILVRRTLAQMIMDEKDGRPLVRLRARVRDAAGRRLMMAHLEFTIDETG